MDSFMNVINIMLGITAVNGVPKPSFRPDRYADYHGASACRVKGAVTAIIWVMDTTGLSPKGRSRFYFDGIC